MGTRGSAEDRAREATDAAKILGTSWRGALDIPDGRVEIDVPTDARSLLMPTLLLQPLVENAVRHGIGTRIGGGTVSIRARADGPVLRIDIMDSGMGFDVTRPRRDGGVGLRSVSDRLRVHYGANAGLTIESAQGGGTRVSLHLPASARAWALGWWDDRASPARRGRRRRPARSFLLALLSGFSDIVVVGEAGNGAEAVQLIESRPTWRCSISRCRMGGISVAGSSADIAPLVVFVTAPVNMQ
jgi:hypothetical protein